MRGILSRGTLHRIVAYAVSKSEDLPTYNVIPIKVMGGRLYMNCLAVIWDDCKLRR